jgi:DNA-binding PadR family transcriptional regulator
VLRCRARLRAGTLYTALDRLRADELIGVDREEIVDSRLRLARAVRALW